MLISMINICIYGKSVKYGKFHFTGPVKLRTFFTVHNVTNDNLSIPGSIKAQFFPHGPIQHNCKMDQNGKYRVLVSKVRQRL